MQLSTVFTVLFSILFSFSHANTKSAQFADCPGSGSILKEIWQNVNGTSVSDIPLNSSPSSTELITVFEGSVNVANNYGTRIRGYICVPQSGNYTFWISGDDNCELWLSSDDDPANKTRIAHVPGWTNSRQWGKYAQQQSAPIPLAAGQTYYIEALHKEAGGGDNIAVGWQLPDGSMERPIQGDKLSPFIENPDNDPPAPPTGLSATAIGSDAITINWNENAENDVANYNIYRSTSPGVSPGPQNRIAENTTQIPYTDTDLDPQTTYYYIVTAIDLSGNESNASNESNATTAATSACNASGTILREVWNNIGGTGVNDIPVNTPPSASNQLLSFEAPVDIADDYGTRIRGYICVPQSGNYTFWISGDDNCELWLSSDDDPANKTRIAHVPGWTNSRQWGKYAQQQSAPIPLAAGQTYYIEALHKEAGGGDNIAVGWQLPDGSMERPIQGDKLSPFIENPDNDPPAPPTGLSATAIGSDAITINWNENAENDVANYNIYRSTSPGVSPGPQNRIAENTTQIPYTDTDLDPQTTYYYIVTAIDLSGNESNASNESNATTAATSACNASGTILREVWNNIGGTGVNDIPVNTPPSASNQLLSFEAPVDIADDYGTRIRGYICVPQSGNYTFWISGDDNCELWLSSDDDPANKTRIAHVPGWTNSREWDKYPEQQSNSISLDAGETYYIEALHKEAQGGDNIAVGWQLPDGSMERPIQGDKLTPFEPDYSDTPPVADAGSDQVLTLPNNATTLDGTASYDLGGTIVNYSWAKTSGPSTFSISGNNTATPTLSNLDVGEYTIELTVTDNDGLSSSDDVKVSVFPPSNSVFDRNDPIVVYNPNNPPPTPARNTVSKWVITRRLNWNTDSYKAYLYVAPNGLKMAFRLRFPKTYDPHANDGKTYPLIIMLHGRGEGGDIYDNEFSMRHGGLIHRQAIEQDKFDGFVMYPQSPKGWWGKFFDPIELMVQKFTEEIKVDPNRVSVHGLSSGGQGVWNYIQEKPKLFASALPMSAASGKYTEGLSDYIYMPLWLSQGGLDSSPTPRAAENLVDAIRAEGGNIRFTLYPDLGHGVWNRHYNEPDFFPFMLRANKTNPHVFYGKTEFCPGESINVRLGVTAGFEAYEWRKNGTKINGATSNEIVVTEPGVYAARFKRNGTWTYWSPLPVNIIIKAPTSPQQIVADGSTALPALDGRTSVTLSAPDGFEAYEWSNGATSQSITMNQAGSYQVSVTEAGGCKGTFSSPVVVSVNGTNGPTAPTNFVATTASSVQINLSWQDNAGNETSYEVYRSTSLNGNYTLLSILPPDENTYSDTNLPFNTTFFYKLRAVNDGGGSPVATTNGTTSEDTQPPAAPGNLTASVLNETEIELTWDDNAFNETGYEVYRGLSANGNFDLLNPNPVNANEELYTDDDFAQNTTYYYKLRAINGNGASNYSNVVSVATLNRAPELNRVGRIYAKSDQPSTFNIIAINEDPQETTTITVNGLPGFASFQDQGNGTGTITLTPDRDDIGLHMQVLITAEDDKNASVNETVSIEVTDGDIISVYVNFNNTHDEGSPWNNMSSTPQANTNLNNLVDDESNITNIGLTLQNSWSGTSAFGKSSGNNTGVFTDRVMQTAFYENSSNTRNITISGLSGANKYNFIFFGSRDSNGNFNTNYTIGSNTATLDAANNTSNTVQINGISPNGSGEVNISIAKAGGAVSALLNAMVMQVYPDNGFPIPPSSLVAMGNSLSSIRLQWNDNADNEDEFEIWRSSTQNGSYSLIGTAPENATSFSDEGLPNNTTYYYKLKAINNVGASNFSNIAAGTTIDFVALVNVNRADNSGIPSYWNNFNSNPGTNVKINNLISTASVQTGITITSLTPWTGEFNDGPVTGNNSGIYPDNVLKTFYYVFPGETGQMKLSGLQSDYVYDVKILGNWRAASQSDYTINNVTLQQNNFRNTSNVAVFSDIAPTNGEITITVESSAGSQAALLNAIEIVGKRTTQGSPAARYLASGHKKEVHKSLQIDTHPLYQPDELSVYPNPFENNFWIDLKQTLDSTLEISLHDLMGKTIYQRKVNLGHDSQLIEISLAENNIKPGVYMLKTYSSISGAKLYRIIKK